jgi:hypothetical protein
VHYRRCHPFACMPNSGASEIEMIISRPSEMGILAEITREGKQ